jgi:hypothetical protein
MAQPDWMAEYQDKRLADLIMPGAHDAGTARGHIDLTRFGTNSNSATQESTITEMLGIGTRFFDVRLKARNNTVVAHHTTAGQGAHSQITVDQVLRDAADFCHDHAGEVVIFRISHTAAGTNVTQIVRNSAAAQLSVATGNLCMMTLAQIRAGGGGLVCVFAEKEFGGVINQAQGLHGFSKYKDSAPTNDHGLSICGCYEGTHTLHKVITNGLKGQYEHNVKHGHRQEHLWQVYWQKTYGNPCSFTGIERGTKKAVTQTDNKWWNRGAKTHGGTHAGTDYLIHLMQGHDPHGNEDFTLKKRRLGRNVMYSTLGVRQYSLPNIISYDFVNEEVNDKIIALNTQNLQAVPDEDAHPGIGVEEI